MFQGQGNMDSKKVGERVSKTNYFKWRGPRVIQSTHRHFSHVETPRPAREPHLTQRLTRNKEPKPGEIHREPKAGAAGLLGDKGAHGRCSQEGFLRRGMGEPNSE